MGGGLPTRSAASSSSSSAAPAIPKLSEGPVAKQIHKIYLDRLAMFIGGGAYENETLRSKLHYGRVSGEPNVKLYVWSAPDLSRPTFKDATSDKNTYRPASIGDSFGPSWSTHWFRVHLTVPPDFLKCKHLEFCWDAGCEGLIWTVDGHPLQGLTGNGERTEFIIPKHMLDGKEHIFYIELACNEMFGNANSGDSNDPPSPNNYYQLSRAEICAVNLTARALYIDFWQISDAAREFPENSWEEHEALQICLDIMNHFLKNNGCQKAIKECREIAQRYIGDKVDSAEVYDSDKEPLVNGIGHCHIDTCWLWPWAETKRKVARSWSNQCDLMDRYPEHRFTCSQAQQYKWLKQYYPSVFDRVKSKVKTGQFQPIGGSWVEHDTNMPSGESLIRQFLYGQRFFEAHFGERSTTFWLPDTFGYSPQIPQLSQLAGMPRFFTQKLSWNNINNFPHTTFNWVALDGSQVLCHMTPAETYTAEAHFGDTMRCVTQHKSMDQDPSSMLVFGKGDGGGGPTWEHIEKLRRQRGMADTVGRLPRVGMGNSVDDFFAKLEKNAKASDTKFTTWYGELYLELHRGTYTTQANNKRNNRKSEILLHDIEYLATMASLKDAFGGKSSSYKYPKKEIDDMWEDVLLCQFHDCLPGSSIEMCYDDSDKLYAAVFKTGEKLVKDALSELGFTDAVRGQNLYAINTLPFQRDEFIHLPGNQSPHFFFREGRGISRCMPVRQTVQPAVSISKIEDDVYQMENSAYSIKVSQGAITSLYDKRADREVIPKGARANQLVLFDDKPLYWQAWDVEVYHLDVRRNLYPQKTEIVEDHERTVALESVYQISDDSHVTVRISLSEAAGSSQHTTPDKKPFSAIEISSRATWHENHKFLKVEFPVDLLNTNASYETQFGIIERPTHYNTSWDTAKFEVCCHKFADLSETTYGVSILNDSKYGFATQGNVMRLSLLRAPKAPDAHADMGDHEMRWAILPHVGPLSLETVRAAAIFNHPLAMSKQVGSKDNETFSPRFPFTASDESSPLSNYIRCHPDPSAVGSLLQSIRVEQNAASGSGIVLSGIKRGEDDVDVARPDLPLAPRKRRSVILRLYEALGGRSRGSVCFGKLPVSKVTIVNLLEDDLEELKIEDDASVKIELRRFEVLTLRLWL